jgi:hypothetical protein
MKNPEESLNKLLDFIVEISEIEQNKWFKNELINRLSQKKSHAFTHDHILKDIKNDTSKVVDYLEINPNCSIDYSFINHKLLKTRLELDNLRMENVRYDLKEKDEMKRLYDFCVNAFYQIENLINYYYYEKYPKIDDLLNHLESIEGTSFRRKEEKSIGDITIAVKIFSFNKTNYNNSTEKFEGMNIDSLRKIRNEGLHRCTRIKSIENESPKLHQFLQYATFDSIHSTVNALAEKIKSLLNK